MEDDIERNLILVSRCKMFFELVVLARHKLLASCNTANPL